MKTKQHFLAAAAILATSNAGCVFKNNSAAIFKKDECPVTSPATDARTFPQAAKAELLRRHAALLQQLATVSLETMPHDVKKLRKDIGDMKLVLDIFFDVYPHTENAEFFIDAHTPLASQIRKDLDMGYEEYGNYKDLFDTQGIDASYDPDTKQWSTGSVPPELRYNANEVNALRIKILDWTSKFTQPDLVSRYHSFLTSPLTEKLADRPKSEQARLFWGSVTIGPSLKKTASENLRLLVGALADAAEKNFEEVLKIENPVKDEDTYHDLRKRLRSMAKIMDFFPDVVASQEVREIQADFLQTSDEMGELFDKIIALHRKNGDKAKKDLEKVLKKWKDMRKDFKESKLDKRLKNLEFIMKCSV